MGALIGAVYLMGYIQGTVALVLGIVALVMVGTGVAGYYAICEPLGIESREEKD